MGWCGGPRRLDPTRVGIHELPCKSHNSVDVANRRASRRITFSVLKAAATAAMGYTGGSIGAHVSSDSKAAYSGKSIARTGQF